jgi:hypothetical protein
MSGETLLKIETDKFKKKLNKFVEVLYKDIDASQSNKKCVIKVLFSLTAVSESTHKKTILVLYALVPEGLKTKKIFGSTLQI